MHKQNHSVLILRWILSSPCFAEFLCVQINFQSLCKPSFACVNPSPMMCLQHWPWPSPTHGSCLRQVSYPCSRLFWSLSPQKVPHCASSIAQLAVQAGWWDDWKDSSIFAHYVAQNTNLASHSLFSWQKPATTLGKWEAAIEQASLSWSIVRDRSSADVIPAAATSLLIQQNLHQEDL